MKFSERSIEPTGNLRDSNGKCDSKRYVSFVITKVEIQFLSREVLLCSFSALRLLTGKGG